ncbi:hypothetical protein J4217_03250 [Candidatus Pacearchaeota archaeon]|nr:hypothetical protein [Candidatus Pacearchaeota archaeon]
MKHTLKITLILIAMFLIAQLVGIAVINQYKPDVKQINVDGKTIENKTYNFPFGMNPPQDTSPESNLWSIVIAIALGVIIILTLMKVRAELFIRFWFFLVIVFALGVTINSIIVHSQISLSARYLIIVGIPLILAIYKVFRRNMIIHNLTELMVYPGIAAIIVPLLNLPMTVILLVLISVYDIYAVWQAGFMQKMAKYQIEKVKVFAGLFVPYIRKEDKALLEKLKKSKSKGKGKKIKVSLAILGGGDVVFPLILAGVVLMTFGFFSAIIIALGATIALSFLFYYSEKGKFYPAMPFITGGCLIALGLVYLINYLM